MIRSCSPSEQRSGRLRVVPLRPESQMELAANVWPVFDEDTGLVLRFFARAYAIEASDSEISRTLHALAPTDFRLAQLFPVPSTFSVTSQFGTLQGCVTLAGFHEDQAAILAAALSKMEEGFAPLQAVSTATPDTMPMGLSLMPRFPAEPYVLVTSLLETRDGQLVPQIG